jgi:rubredoxin
VTCPECSYSPMMFLWDDTPDPETGPHSEEWFECPDCGAIYTPEELPR